MKTLGEKIDRVMRNNIIFYTLCAIAVLTAVLHLMFPQAELFGIESIFYEMSFYTPFPIFFMVGYRLVMMWIKSARNG